MKNIGSLLCGTDKCDGIAKVALDQLRTSIESFASRALNFLNGSSPNDIIAFGPFCTRVLLENSCAALVARIDSFRILYLSEFQGQPEYDHGKRARSGFSWAGDVMPDEKAAQILWNLESESTKISRALFSKHIEHIYWKPAVEGMLDFASKYSSDQALVDILKMDADTYISETKGRSTRLYSTLSKGVHWEFFNSALVLDEVTTKSIIHETCLLVAHLGLASHFIPTAYASLQPEQAIDHYIEFRKHIP